MLIESSVSSLTPGASIISASRFMRSTTSEAVAEQSDVVRFAQDARDLGGLVLDGIKTTGLAVRASRRSSMAVSSIVRPHR
jgi:hypothetical protein